MTTIDISDRKQGEFWAALAEAEKGTRIIYSIGKSCSGPHRKDAAQAEAQARVFLFCKRAGPGLFSYLAVKR
jgi:hypothetical protein